uniref:hypothetical protein n=1 Tax=Candidatus Cryptobacteroides bacterium TaxID=3085639 RepID=UPI004029D3E4
MKFGNLIKCAAWIAALASVFACAKEVGPGYEEGLPVTSIKMSISAPGQDKIDISTKASEAVESAVEQIAIFFYKANDANAMPIVSEITPTFASNVGSNYKYNIVIPATDLEEMRSGKWYMYAVANYGKGFFPVDINALKGLTRTEFLDYCITKQNNALDILETSVLMSGKYCAAGKTYDQCDGSLDIKPGENKLDGIIRLRRSVAKITFEFVNGSHTIEGKTTTARVTFKPESYGLYEYSRSCTLMERDNWKDEFPYKGDTKVSEENRFHNGSDFPIMGSQFAFYMPENAQTGNVKGKPTGGWTYFNREERESNGKTNPTQEQYNEFRYAPKHGTFVAVKGTISIPEENYSGDVTYYIHLGNFTKSADDFTVRRNYHYTYTITVNGVDNIIAEAKAEDGSEIQPGAEGNITHTTDAYLDVRLDSHYETVLLKVEANVDAGTYAIRVNSPYSKNVMVKSTDSAVDFDAKKKNLDYGWIRFGKPTGNKGYRSYPGVSGTTDVFGLIADLQSTNTTKTYWSKDTYNGETYYYTIAYVNEYYYEDKMPADDAGKTAELKKFINADDRTMSVILGPNVFESNDGHSTYTDLTHGFFNISQRSIKTFYDLSVANPFGIEQVEETAVTSNYGGTGTDSDNGYANNPTYSSSSIFGSVKKYSWSDYISNGFNGHVEMAKNNAEYQCLSRNRDENGDGKIDGEELKWYLPAVNQCTYYWFGMNSLPEDARIELPKRAVNNYWTSTFKFATWWAAEGSAYGDKYVETGTSGNKVRCVRSLKDYDKATSEISQFDVSTMVVTMVGMDSKSVREAGTVNDEVAEHFRGSEHDVLPSSFKIAKKNLQSGNSDRIFTSDELKTGTFCRDYYSEEAGDSDKGKWRIPNEKELTLMLKWLRKENTYITTLRRLAAKTQYERHGSSDDMIYYITGTVTKKSDGTYDDNLIITTSARAQDMTEGFKVRCVRDIVK